MDIAAVEPGAIPACPVAPDALPAVKRQQTNPERWQGRNWPEFAAAVRAAGVDLIEQEGLKGTFATDAGGMAYGLPHGVVIARSALQVSELLRFARHMIGFRAAHRVLRRRHHFVHWDEAGIGAQRPRPVARRLLRQLTPLGEAARQVGVGAQRV